MLDTSPRFPSPHPPFASGYPPPFHICFLFLLSHTCFGKESLTCGPFSLEDFVFFKATLVWSGRRHASPSPSPPLPPPSLPICIDGGPHHTNGMFIKKRLFTQNSSRSCVSNQKIIMRLCTLEICAICIVGLPRQASIVMRFL